MLNAPRLSVRVVLLSCDGIGKRADNLWLPIEGYIAAKTFKGESASNSTSAPAIDVPFSLITRPLTFACDKRTMNSQRVGLCLPAVSARPRGSQIPCA